MPTPPPDLEKCKFGHCSQCWETELLPEPFYHTMGAEIEMRHNGEWKRGKVVEDQCFKDDTITMITPEGEKIWCYEGHPYNYRMVASRKE